MDVTQKIRVTLDATKMMIKGIYNLKLALINHLTTHRLAILLVKSTNTLRYKIMEKIAGVGILTARKKSTNGYLTEIVVKQSENHTRTLYFKHVHLRVQLNLTDKDFLVF